MYQAAEIRLLHLEITTKCSARCPQCLRNLNGGATNPELPQVELSRDDVEHILPPRFVRQLKHITICGNYGDPTAAQDTLSTFQYFRSVSSQLSLQINSHGSARSADWWKELGSVGITCHFGIDGLRDTNHIYRQDTNWDRIIRNVSSFVLAGGDAVWDFIVFSHNEHQVDAAKALSKQLGFSRFVVKRSARFLGKGGMVSQVPIMSRNGSASGELALARDSRYHNEALRKIDSELGTAERYRHYLSTTGISCKALNNKGIYISAEGLVLPCCYLGHIYPARTNPGALQVSELLERLPQGRSSICAFTRSIETILEDAFFQKAVPSGWGLGDARLQTCAQQCGAYDALHAERQQSEQ